MANNIELPCPDDCPLRPMTHQHLQKAEGQPHRKKHKKRRFDSDDQANTMVRKTEQKRLYKRKR